MTKEHVAARKHERAVFRRGEIDVATGAFETFPVRNYFTINTQSRDAAVGKDPETKVRDPFAVIDRKRVARVAGKLRLR